MKFFLCVVDLILRKQKQKQKVTDELILHWANETCSRLDYKNSKHIRGFRDKSLTTGLFYLDLLRAVVPEAVNEDLIYDSIPVLEFVL